VKAARADPDRRVFGGPYSGVFTVNEAASVAAVLSFLFALARGGLTWKTCRGAARIGERHRDALRDPIGASSSATSSPSRGFRRRWCARSRTCRSRRSPSFFVLLAGYLILGAVFDEISAMLITLPFVLPGDRQARTTGGGHHQRGLLIELGMISRRSA